MSVSLGTFHGLYKFKGALTSTAFTGEYDGPDEKGTFKMTLTPVDSKTAPLAKTPN